MTTRYYEDDLEANRAGRLSENQKRKVIRDANKGRAVYWILFALLGGLVVAALLEFRSILEQQPLVWLALALGGFFIGIFFTMQWWAADQQTRAEVRDGAVDMVEGTVTVFNGGSKAEPIYTVSIGHHTIEDLPEPVFKAFEDGRRYRVYFLRKRILSAERVE